MKINRIVLSGGGTGGHIYPALSVYRYLKEENPDLECLYIGSEKGLEKNLVTDLNIPFKSVEIQGLRRSLSMENFKAIWLMLQSIQRSKKMIKEFKPDVIVGTGGYVCAPVLYAGAKLGIPTLIHEQNSIAGLTNKFLSRYVDIIAICFETAAKDFGKYKQKIRLTGNPRAQEIVNIKKDSSILSKQFNLSDNKPTILIFGGSRGAPAINEAALQNIEKWSDKDYQIIIATGQSHYDKFMNQLSEMKVEIGNNVVITPYIKNMPYVFQMIDLVICRSGATTLTELLALGLPSILVPSPYVTANHQEYNARALVDNGAAEMILEKDLTPQRLFDKIDEIVQDDHRLEFMAKQNKQLAIVDATSRIVNELENIKNLK